jgi:hypothetical protein
MVDPADAAELAEAIHRVVTRGDSGDMSVAIGARWSDRYRAREKPAKIRVLLRGVKTGIRIVQVGDGCIADLRGLQIGCGIGRRHVV